MNRGNSRSPLERFLGLFAEVKAGEGVVIPLMLASMKRELLQKQLKRRGREKSKRETRNHLEDMDDIWELQSWLLDEADRAGIYIIENWQIEKTVRTALDLVIGVIMKHFPPQADEEVWEA